MPVATPTPTPKSSGGLPQDLILSDQDKFTLWFILGYSIGIFVLWNFPVLKHILTPFKLVVTGLHEFGHAIVGKCTGAKIHSIEINLDTCGVTKMRGGIPWLTLPAGYVGSAFFGGVMVFAGFNVLASKIVSVAIGLCFLLTLYWAAGIVAGIISLLYIGLIIAFWIIQQGAYLRFIVLFMGVMASMQSLWDFQALVFRKISQSDASKYAELVGCLPAQGWAFVWALFGIVFTAGFALLGVIAF
jgi:uncharacterized membrane protein